MNKRGFIISTMILCATFAVLISYSIRITKEAQYYKEEYERAQKDLIDSSIQNQELEEDLKEAKKNNLELLEEVTYLKTEPKVKYKTYSVPFGHNSFRSWMPHSAISVSSRQGQLLKTATPDNDGLMKINDCYCVALGTYYGELGDVFQITTSTGSVFRVIKTDVKANNHTDSLNQYTVANNCMMEFIVNKNLLNSSIKSVGSVNTDIIKGSIVKIEKEVY